MSLLREAWARLRSFFRKGELDADFSEELASHIELAAEDNLRQGMTPAEARRQALIQLGGIEPAKEAHREWRGLPWLDGIVQDLRHAFRSMGRTPGFTLTIIAVLSLGIGANTAIFSLLNTLMLRPLPVRDPGELVEFLSVYPGDPRLNSFNWKYFERFRDQNHVFSGMTGVSPNNFQVSLDGGETEELLGGYVPGNFFSMVGVKPGLGRLIEPQDDRLGSPNAAVAVVSWSFWNSRFHLDPSILGKQIVVNREPVTIIGVTPREFIGLQVGTPRFLWIPAAMTPSQRATGELSLQLIARLKPGVSIEQAQAEMRLLDRERIEDIARNSPTKDPVLRQMRLDVEPASAGFSQLRERFGKPLLALMALVALLLLLMCVNVSSLLLAKAVAREREMAVRVSLGASRFRLLRQVLTESLALSALACAAGLGLAYVGAAFLVHIVVSGRRPPGVPPIEINLQLDGRVLLFSLAVALTAGLLFGLIPAFRAMRSAPMNSLRAAGKSSETRFARLFGRGLVATQVGLSVVLLSAAGLFAAHLSNLRNVGIGFASENLLLVSLDPSINGQGESLPLRCEQLLTSLQAIPGVHSASLVGATPISGAAASLFITAEGFEEPQQDRRYTAMNGVGPRYFETLGTPLLAGREFGVQDWQGRNVAIVNETLAEHYFAGRDPLGRHVTFDRSGETYEIVGVVGDAKYYELRDPPPRTIYLSAVRDGRVRARNIVVRTNVSPASLESQVRRTIDEVLADFPVVKVTTMTAQIDEAIVPERLVALLSGLFGVLGALLAAIGLYGLLAYLVARRVNEIGIRMALGAAPRKMAGMVFRDALATVSVGLALGTGAALGAKRLAAAVFSDLPIDQGMPLVLGAAAMMIVGLLASYMPCRRAARTNPVEALRHD
jgi:predicted permease